MNGFELCFELPWLLLLFPVAVFFIWRSYRYTYRGRKRPRESCLPLFLRLLAALCASLMLAGCTVMTNRVPVSVLIAADVSASTDKQQSAVTKAVLDLLKTLPETQDTGVVSFAQDARLELPIGGKRTLSALTAPDNPAVTDISNVLNYSLSLMDSNTRRRVILLTDGRETDGNALAVAHALANKGIRVDAMAFKSDVTTPEAQVTSVALPADVALGSVCKVVVTVTSNDSIRATLSLFDEDTLVREASVRLKKGDNTFNYTVSLSTAGMRVFTARLTPVKDTIPENNLMTACVNVSVSGATLIIDGTGQDGQALSDLMGANGYQTKLIAPGEFPHTLEEMCRYGMIVLANVNEHDLRTEAASMLEEYIRVYGRSVLVTGGENAFIYGNYLNTAFEEFLPVRMDVKQADSVDPTALVLVVDCSASMGIPMIKLHTSSLNPLEMAKRGAIKCASQLHENDLISVISFSDKTYVMQEMTNAANNEQVVGAISRMATMGGTMYKDALAAALEQFDGLQPSVRKHVIFLSDGNAGDEDYEVLVREMLRRGISLTTIAVGDDIDASILMRMAQEGGGLYYRVTDPYDLPTIMLSDAVLQQVDCKIEGAFIPAVAEGTQCFEQDAVLPELNGYIRTEIKPEAELVLYMPQRHPLLAQWRYGAGLCGAFTSDVSGQWSAKWLNTPEGQLALLHIIDTLLPQSNSVSAVGAKIVSGGKEGVLRVTCADRALYRSFTAEITSPDGSVSRVSLTSQGDGIFEQTISLRGAGKYLITLHPLLNDGTSGQPVQTAAAVAWSKEYDAFFEETSADLLQNLCLMTGGEVMRSASALCDVSMDDVYIEYDPMILLTLTTAVCVLLELTLRRFRRRLSALLHRKAPPSASRM